MRIEEQGPLSDNESEPLQPGFIELDGKKILAVGSAATLFLAAVALAGHELRKHHAAHREPDEPGDNPQ